MARFPVREAEVRSLAQHLITGLAANAALYPSPPVSPVVLQAALDSFVARSNEAVAAQAAADQAFASKAAELEKLVVKMKADLRYAEDAAGYDDATLSALGWGGKAARRALQAPGQPLNLAIPRQGDGWLFLEWNEPVDGGAVATYKIERRERPAGEWTLISLALESEATLNNQERGKDWEYRIVAVNKAGESAPSNTAAAVV